MSVKLDQVIPWGRSKQEYELMFQLTSKDFEVKILGCGDGPASFNAQMTESGHSVVSIDPIYAFTGREIEEKFYQNADSIISQVRLRMENYVWKFHRDPDDLKRNREIVLKQFLGDFDSGKANGRYLVGELPKLEFPDQNFDLALCSHLLFLYSEIFDFEFHWNSIRELCRVAREVRVFPLTGLDCELSPHLTPILRKLAQEGYIVEVVKSDYQLQRNGYEYLRVTRKRPIAQ